MFQTGDMIIYKNLGVCRVTGITKPDFVTGEENKLYYVLRPVYQDGVVYVPTDTKVFMRPIITADEAEKLIDMIPDIRAEAYHNSNAQMLTAHYESVIKTHDCSGLIRLTKSIRAKKQELDKQNRKFGHIDERYMIQAEELLFEELAAAIGIAKDSVKSYIASRTGDTKQ